MTRKTRATPRALLGAALSAAAVFCGGGCLTITAPSGLKISATGDATATVGPDGTLTVANHGTANTYRAIAEAAGTAAGIAAKTAAQP